MIAAPEGPVAAEAVRRMFPAAVSRPYYYSYSPPIGPRRQRQIAIVDLPKMTATPSERTGRCLFWTGSALEFLLQLLQRQRQPAISVEWPEGKRLSRLRFRCERTGRAEPQPLAELGPTSSARRCEPRSRLPSFVRRSLSSFLGAAGAFGLARARSTHWITLGKQR